MERYWKAWAGETQEPLAHEKEARTRCRSGCTSEVAGVGHSPREGNQAFLDCQPGLSAFGPFLPSPGVLASPWFRTASLPHCKRPSARQPFRIPEVSHHLTCPPHLPLSCAPPPQTPPRRFAFLCKGPQR